MCYATGDANCDCVNTTIDLFMVIDVGGSGFLPIGDGCGDFNYDGVKTTIDRFRIIDVGGSGFLTCPIPSPPCVPL